MATIATTPPMRAQRAREDRWASSTTTPLWPSVTARRQTRVTDQFFDRLDELLPSERTATGTPSATDFLAYDLPAVLDELAVRYEDVTFAVDESAGVRVFIAAGALVSRFAVYAELVAGVIEVFWLEIDLGWR